MSDDRPKSAVELAMERLRKKDAEAGIERQELTEEQKAALAETRSVYDAQLAQLQVLHESTVRGVLDPDQLAALEANHRRDRERVISDRDAKLERIRKGEA
jgi:hypothetical protein